MDLSQPEGPRVHSWVFMCKGQQTQVANDKVETATRTKASFGHECDLNLTVKERVDNAQKNQYQRHRSVMEWSLFMIWLLTIKPGF